LLWAYDGTIDEFAPWRHGSFDEQAAWIVQARIRVDLFGVIDLIAMREGVGVVGVQACAGASHAARRAKAIAEPRLVTWLASGGRFEVASWSKRGKRGSRKRWAIRREELVLVNGEVVPRFESTGDGSPDKTDDLPDKTEGTPGLFDKPHQTHAA